MRPRCWKGFPWLMPQHCSRICRPARRHLCWRRCCRLPPRAFSLLWTIRLHLACSRLPECRALWRCCDTSGSRAEQHSSKGCPPRRHWLRECCSAIPMIRSARGPTRKPLLWGRTRQQAKRWPECAATPVWRPTKYTWWMKASGCRESSDCRCCCARTRRCHWPR